MDLFDDIRAMLPPAEVRDAAVFNVIRPPAAEHPTLTRLRVGPRFAEELLATIGAVIADAERHVDGSEAMDAIVDYTPGSPLGPGQIAHAPDAGRVLHQQAASLRTWLEVDPLGRPQMARDEEVRAIGLSVVGAGRVTILRRRDALQAFKSKRDRHRLLAVFSNGQLEGTEYVFAYDGGWDAILYGDDALIRDPAAFEAILGIKPPVDEQLAKVVEQLKVVVPEDDLNRLLAHAPSRDRLRDVDPDVVRRLQSEEARDIVKTLDFDEVFLVDGKLTFGTSNTARAQTVRLLADGFLSSALTTKSYAASSKERWPARRIVTSVRAADGVVTHLLGEADWSPRSAEAARRDIKQHDSRYSARVGEDLLPVRVSRAAASRGQLWVESRGQAQDGVPAKANLLPLLAQAEP